MSRELRTSSLYEIPPQPLWLRRLQWAGITCEVFAIALMLIHLSFGLWQRNWWYDAAVILPQAFFIWVQTRVQRWNREQRHER